jgi:hypothetical protein
MDWHQLKDNLFLLQFVLFCYLDPMNWSVSGIGHDAQSECVHRDEIGKLETIFG